VTPNNKANQLCDGDFDALARSYITPELARQSHLFRVDSAEGASLVGREGRREDYAGIVFPYYLPGTNQPREYRLRRDRPDYIEQADGTLKEQGKYLSPPSSRNLAYFVPGTHKEWLQDSSLPVAIVEGEKKTISLFRLAMHERQTPRFLSVGLAGVWCWKGTIGKTQDENGARRSVKGVISDFDHIVWHGRTVFIIFDTNVATNESVRVARQQLAKELKRRGAIVHFVDLPQMEGVNGVDDLLGLKGADYVLALIESSKPYSEDAPARKPQATNLVELAEGAELFHTPEGDAYATVKCGEHLETWSLKAHGFRNWLMRQYYESEGSAPSSQAVQDSLDVLRGRAQFDGVAYEVHTRIAEYEGAIYLDLCDELWRTVCISSDDWRIVNNPPVKFRRAKGMLQLPEPKQGGTINSLQDYVNVASDDWALIVSWLVAAYRPGKPFPVLALHGEQGSAKSTTARVLRALIDPNKADLRSEPREERDLMIAAKNGWLIALDNLSRIHTWLSDALCRLATGGGFATRELYANDEEVLFDAKRPILLNGIEELATRSDLLERAIVLNLPTIPEHKRKTEARFWQEFEIARPSLLGALLNAVSGALRDHDSVRLERLPRMADFAQWATAAENYLGLAQGAFMAAYTGNRAASNDLALEASPVAAGIISFVEDKDHWIGTSSELLKELTQRTTDDAQRQKGFPKAANSLSGILKRIAPNLRAAGVNVTRPNRAGKKGARLIELERINISSSEVSEAAAMRDVHADSLCSSDDLAGNQNISDDLSGDSRQASSRENAVETATSANADDTDDFSQGFSSRIAEYEPDEEELIYEAEERAAIMAESNAL
jgi:Domain of unknown function (DUF3854)